MGIAFRRIAVLSCSVFLLVGASGSAFPQSYPNKPIRLLVGFAPGGGTDLLARLVGQRLSERLGQPVTVENRPGANTIIATEVAARAAPDGYTLAMAATPNVTNPSLYAKLPYDTSKDFTWITQLTVASLVLLVNNSVPANSVQELIALAKKEPGKLAYGSAGAGGSVHLAGVLLEKMSNISLVHIPYKGSGPAFSDFLGGRLSLIFADIPQVASYIKSGKVRPIAVTTTKRSAGLPDVPTFAESGLSGYEVPVWYGVYGPTGIPKNIVDKLSKEFKEVLNTPAVKEQFSTWGVEPVGSTPEEFESFIRTEMAKWALTVKSAGIRLD